MPDTQSLRMLQALVQAHQRVNPQTGGRTPILYVEYIGGVALNHHAAPASGWPDYDKATLDELRSEGLIRIENAGGSSQIMPTELGRTVVAQHDRAMSTEPVADTAGVLSAVDAQVSSANPLAWPVLRPLLVALRDYWQAGGYSAHGVQLVALLHAVPDNQEAMLRAAVVELEQGGYLRSTTPLSANDIPVAVALTDRAHAILDGWPGAGPEDLVDNLLAVLTASAAAETDEQRKGKLQRLIDTVRDIGVATASEVLAKVVLGK